MNITVPIVLFMLAGLCLKLIRFKIFHYNIDVQKNAQIFIVIFFSIRFLCMELSAFSLLLFSSIFIAYKWNRLNLTAIIENLAVASEWVLKSQSDCKLKATFLQLLVFVWTFIFSWRWNFILGTKRWLGNYLITGKQSIILQVLYSFRPEYVQKPWIYLNQLFNFFETGNQFHVTPKKKKSQKNIAKPNSEASYHFTSQLSLSYSLPTFLFSLFRTLTGCFLNFT